MRLFADMQADVIALRLDPVNFIGSKKNDPAGIPDRQPVPRLTAGAQLFQQRAESSLAGRGGALGELSSGAPDRLAQAVVLEGLEQVVERADFEGADGVLIESGHEHYQRQTVRL